LPEQSYVRGLIHADLHVDNVFCRASSADVIVIDYAKAVQGPVVADYACLEVSLTFPNLYESQAKPELLALPEDWLRKIYSYPPLASSIIAHDDIADGVMRAVRAIRANMTMREPDQQVYAIALAAYLLRFAAFEDQVIRRRSFAYLLAAMLVARVPAK
jgi:Ser/Thr protein kinase RdoA (MazF antagonist)